MEKARPEKQAFLHFGLSSPSTLKAERFRLVVRYHVSVLRFQVHLAGLELKLRYICSCSDLYNGAVVVRTLTAFRETKFN